MLVGWVLLLEWAQAVAIAATSTADARSAARGLLGFMAGSPDRREDGGVSQQRSCPAGPATARPAAASRDRHKACCRCESIALQEIQMSVIDKVIAAVTPPETEKARSEARAKARSAAANCEWLSLVLQHHLQIEDAFAAVKAASDATSRRRAQQWLATILTGHSIAEESVIYPALALHGEKTHAGAGYTEQSAVKIQMAALEDLEPMSRDYEDKLEHIRGAVAHHVYEEEGNWFIDLIEKTGPGQIIATRYMKEFKRYMGADTDSSR
jgi:hypothetical protein